MVFAEVSLSRVNRPQALEHREQIVHKQFDKYQANDGKQGRQIQALDGLDPAADRFKHRTSNAEQDTRYWIVRVWINPAEYSLNDNRKYKDIQSQRDEVSDTHH